MDAAGSAKDRRFGARRLLLLALVVVGSAVVLVWFQPQKLLLDTRVDEAPPAAGTDEGTAAAQGGASSKGREMVLTGSFRSIDHATSGTATLARAGDGRYYVRLERFSTENGPDLVVYLSSAPASAHGREFAEDFIDLGTLKGNIGNQNYLVPKGADPTRYRSVVIWCRRFTTPFGAAPLQPS
jgi:hypothetical protein